MPKLPTYTAELQGALPISGGRRADGADFGGQVAAATVQAGRTIGAAAESMLQSLEQEDQRKMLVGHAELRAKYAKALHDAELSGEEIDPIRLKFENEATSLRDQTSTAAGAHVADLHTQNSMAVFDTRAAQINIERAGAEARSGGQKLLSNNSAILMMQGMGYLPVAIAEGEAYADTFAGRLRPQQITEMKRSLREHLTVAGVSSEIMTGDPMAVRNKLVAGEWSDIGPEARQTLLSRAETQDRTNKAQAIQAERDAAWQANEVSRAAKGEHLKSIFAGQFSPRDVLADNRLTPEHFEHLMVFNEAWWRQKTGQEKLSDQRTVNDLWLRIYAREGDPRKIINDDAVYEALKAGRINATDFNRLRVAVAEQRDGQNTPIGRQLGRALGTMQKLYSGPTWIGREHQAANIINSWFHDVQDRIDEKRKNNDSAGLADMFNPKSKEYIMDAEYLAGFVRGGTGGPIRTVEPGTTVVFPDGVERRFKGGDPRDVDKAWEVVGNAGPQEILLPISGIRVRWNRKGDKNDLANWEPVEPFKPSGNDISPANAAYKSWHEEAAKERSEFFNSLTR